MDNDLMARRLRPPSQPPSPQASPHASPQNGQPQPIEAGPGQDWDEPITPDPAARADVPWDRPAPEP